MERIFYTFLILFLNTCISLAATFTVTNTSESGTGSLRKAINDANINGNPTQVDLIVFNIPNGPYVINVPGATPFPEITQPLFIDGSTQPGFANGNIITLVGPSYSTGSYLLKISSTAPGSEIKGLQMQQMGTGILAYDVDELTINGNYINECQYAIDIFGNDINVISNRIGTDVTGTIDRGNYSDAIIVRYSRDVLIENNLISANLGNGIFLDYDGTKQVTIRNNKIGTDINGFKALGNAKSGIAFGRCNDNYYSDGGDSCFIEDNLISGNLEHGIYLRGADANTIIGNKIGTDGSGANPLGNGGNGIMLDPPCGLIHFIDLSNLNNKIGGSSAGDANIIAFNGGDGIYMAGKDLGDINAYSDFNKISRNIFLNNTGNAININYDATAPDFPGNRAKLSPNAPKPKPVITSYENNIVSGTSEPKDLIEIFGSSKAQNANAYLISTNADASGNWSVNVSATGFAFLVATATDSLGRNSPDLENTSELSDPILLGEIPCHDCISSFAPEPGKTYIISGWAKEQGASPNKTSYTYPEIYVEFPSVSVSEGPFKPTGEIIDGWQRIEGEFMVPANATDINIKLTSSSGNVKFDDVRVHPFDAVMKAYVYDPATLFKVAELDERNYASFIERDEEGKQTRVKKETERGVMTIEESKSNRKKR